MSNRCCKCEGVVKVNYSCYDEGKTEVYICNDCEQEYYGGNYELYSVIGKNNLINK